MIIDVTHIDTTPGATPGPCSMAFIPPVGFAGSKADYGYWLLERCRVDLEVRQQVYSALRWQRCERGRPITAVGPYADAFPRILKWLEDKFREQQAA